MEDLIAMMEELATGLEAAAAPEKWGCAITNKPFAVFSADFSMALLVEEGGATPVGLRPHLCGFSMFDRETAQRVAEHCTANNPTDWVVSTPKEAAAKYAAKTRELLAFTRERMASLQTA